MFFFGFFFFKQKTAYEMRISDWSSDVCSSDLELELELHAAVAARDRVRHVAGNRRDRTVGEEDAIGRAEGRRFDADRRFHSCDRLGVQERGTVRLRDALAQRRAPARKAGRKRDHNRAGAVQPHHHASRRAVVTGWVAARRAGNRPPTKPIASAHFRPVHSTSGETLNAHVSWPTPPAMVEAV